MHAAQVKKNVSVLVSVASRLCMQHRLRGISVFLYLAQLKGNSVLVYSRV